MENIVDNEAVEAALNSYSKSKTIHDLGFDVNDDKLKYLCDFLHITPAEFVAMTDYELNLRLENARGCLRLQIAKKLLSYRLERLKELEKLNEINLKPDIRLSGGVTADQNFSGTNSSGRHSTITDLLQKSGKHFEFIRAIDPPEDIGTHNVWDVLNQASEDIDELYRNDAANFDSNSINNLSMESQKSYRSNISDNNRSKSPHSLLKKSGTKNFHRNRYLLDEKSKQINSTAANSMYNDQNNNLTSYDDIVKNSSELLSCSSDDTDEDGWSKKMGITKSEFISLLKDVNQDIQNNDQPPPLYESSSSALHHYKNYRRISKSAPSSSSQRQYLSHQNHMSSTLNPKRTERMTYTRPNFSHQRTTLQPDLLYLPQSMNKLLQYKCGDGETRMLHFPTTYHHRFEQSIYDPRSVHMKRQVTTNQRASNFNQRNMQFPSDHINSQRRHLIAAREKFRRNL